MIEIAIRVFDPLALLIVVGGTIVVATVSAAREDIGRAVLALGPLFRARPGIDALAATGAASDIERIAERKGFACADRVRSDIPFVRQAALKFADAPSADAFATWAHDALEARATRHQSAAAVWRAAADAAPAMGMIGTVLGLIGMFATMDDPDRIGAAMALAMLTTLYGLVISALVAGPVAARLERLSGAELRWQRTLVARLEALARAGAAPRPEWQTRSALIEE